MWAHVHSCHSPHVGARGQQSPCFALAAASARSVRPSPCPRAGIHRCPHFPPPMPMHSGAQARGNWHLYPLSQLSSPLSFIMTNNTGENQPPMYKVACLVQRCLILKNYLQMPEAPHSRASHGPPVGNMRAWLGLTTT